MNKRTRFPLDRSFFQILCFCMALIALPFLCFYGLFQSLYIPNLQRNERSNQQAIVQSVAVNVEGIFRQMVTMAQEMGNIVDLHTYYIRKNALSELAALQQLERMSVYVDTVDAAMLLVDNLQKTYSNTWRILTFEDFASRFSTAELSGDELLDSVFASGYRLWQIACQPQTGNETPKNYICLSLPDSANTIRDRRAVLLFCPQEKLQSMLRVDGYVSALAYTTPEGTRQLLTSGGDEAQARLLLDGEPALSRHIATYGLTLLMSPDENNSVSAIQQEIGRFWLWTLLFCLLSGVLLTLCIRCLWRPLRDLKGLVRSSFGDETVHPNTYDYIRENIRRHAKQAAHNEQRLQHAHETLSDYRDLRLLLGCAEESPADSAEALPLCRVALVRGTADDQSGDLPSLLRDLCVRWTKSGLQANPIALSQRQTAILFRFTPDARALLPRLLDELMHAVSAEFGSGCSIGVGNVYKGSAQLYLSRMEAQQALDWRLLIGRDKVILFEDLPETRERCEIPFELAKGMEKSILAGDAEAFRRQLEEISAFLQQQNLSLHLSRCFMYELLNMLIRVVNANASLQQEEVRAYVEQLSQLTDDDNLDNLLETVETLAWQLCERYAAERDALSDSVYEKMVDYVRQHACDPDFSVALMADVFGMAQSSLRYFFKKHHTDSLSSYVEEVRMEQAAALLLETNMPVKEVAETVGYSDSTAFIRRFRSVFGCAPGSWRTMQKKKKLLDG